MGLQLRPQQPRPKRSSEFRGKWGSGQPVEDRFWSHQTSKMIVIILFKFIKMLNESITGKTHSCLVFHLLKILSSDIDVGRAGYEKTSVFFFFLLGNVMHPSCASITSLRLQHKTYNSEQHDCNQTGNSKSTVGPMTNHLNHSALNATMASLFMIYSPGML